MKWKVDPSRIWTRNIKIIKNENELIVDGTIDEKKLKEGSESGEKLSKEREQWNLKAHEQFTGWNNAKREKSEE